MLRIALIHSRNWVCLADTKSANGVFYILDVHCHIKCCTMNATGDDYREHIDCIGFVVDPLGGEQFSRYRLNPIFAAVRARNTEHKVDTGKIGSRRHDCPVGDKVSPYTCALAYQKNGRPAHGDRIASLVVLPSPIYGIVQLRCDFSPSHQRGKQNSHSESQKHDSPDRPRTDFKQNKFQNDKLR